MLYEIDPKKVQQYEDEGYRRWFTDEYFDLIVWYDTEDCTKRKIIGFQLSYDRYHSIRALTWRRGNSNTPDRYLHNRVDEGDRPGKYKQTPILVANGVFAKKEIAEKFKHNSKNIDREIADLVYRKILDYPDDR